jgi:hypothetical protein
MLCLAASSALGRGGGGKARGEQDRRQDRDNGQEVSHTAFASLSDHQFLAELSSDEACVRPDHTDTGNVIHDDAHSLRAIRLTGAGV